MTTVAIIPARKGSKGISNKNMALINDKPLIQYTIDAAKKSSKIDYIVVTTDWHDVIELSKKLNVDYIRHRPDFLASDTASMVDTLDDTLKWLNDEYKLHPDTFVLLQPTSPLRITDDIDKSVDMMSHDVPSVISVNRMKEHPYECVEVRSNAQWTYLAEPEVKVSRRQDYKSNFYYINGAVYVVKTSYFNDALSLVSNNTRFYVMPDERCVDIDEQSDLDFVRFLMCSSGNNAV